MLRTDLDSPEIHIAHQGKGLNGTTMNTGLITGIMIDILGILLDSIP